jgi:hypothetical protein
MNKFTDKFLDDVAQAMTFAKTDIESLCIAAVKIAGERGTVTADDIRDAVTITRDKRILGIALGRLKVCNVIYVVGYQATAEKASHGRPVFIFALTPHWKTGWPSNYMMPDGVSEGTPLLEAREKELVDLQGRERHALTLLEEANKHLRAANKQIEELQMKTKAVNATGLHLQAATRDLLREAKTLVITDRWRNMKLIRDAEATLLGNPYPGVQT